MAAYNNLCNSHRNIWLYEYDSKVIYSERKVFSLSEKDGGRSGKLNAILKTGISEFVQIKIQKQ